MLLYSLATVTQINPVVDGAVEAVEYALARERSRTASPRADERVERQPEPATAITGSLMVSPSTTVMPSGIHAPPKPRLCGQGRSCRALARFANPDSLDFGTLPASKPGNWIPDSRERAPNAIASMAFGPGQGCGTCPCTSRIGCRQERCIPARPLRTPPAGRPCAKSQTRLRPVGSWSERLDQSAKSRPCSEAAECRSFR